MPPDHLTDKGHELTRRMLTETREELARADGKASILLASVGVVVGVLLGGIITGDWSPDKLACAAEGFWWIGVAAAGGGMLSLSVAVYPRLVPAAPGRVTYFEDVRRHETCAALLPHINTEAERGDRDAEQLWRLSKIAHKKYRAIQVAEWLLMGAAALTLGAVLLG